MSDFYDITDPEAFLPEPSTPWWIWLLLALTVALLLGGLFFFIKRRKTSNLQATQLDKARKLLAKLQKESPNLPPHVIATRISLIIRRYLETAFNEPALFETNEEFTLRESALAQLHPDSRQPITQHLTTLSQLKYAPKASASNNSNTTSLITDAEAILANIEINVNNPEE